MNSTGRQAPQYISFLFSPQLQPFLLWPQGSASGSLARSLIRFIGDLLAGHDLGQDPVFGEYDERQLDAMFASDAGMDWAELSACHDALRRFEHEASDLSRREIHQLATEVVDDYLLLDLSGTERMVRELVAYACRLRGATKYLNQEVIMPPMPKPPPFRFGFIFNPRTSCTISLAKGGCLTGGLLAALNLMQRSADELAALRPESSLRRALEHYHPVDAAELERCQRAFNQLLDPALHKDEKALGRMAEGFIDDYLLVQAAGDERRLVADIVAWTIRGVGPPGAQVKITDSAAPTEWNG